MTGKPQPHRLHVHVPATVARRPQTCAWCAWCSVCLIVNLLAISGVLR